MSHEKRGGVEEAIAAVAELQQILDASDVSGSGHIRMSSDEMNRWKGVLAQLEGHDDLLTDEQREKVGDLRQFFEAMDESQETADIEKQIRLETGDTAHMPAQRILPEQDMPVRKPHTSNAPGHRVVMLDAEDVREAERRAKEKKRVAEVQRQKETAAAAQRRDPANQPTVKIKKKGFLSRLFGRR
jgi:hypothetical protein